MVAIFFTGFGLLMTDGVSVLVFVEMVLSFVSTLSVEEESLLFDTSFIEFPSNSNHLLRILQTLSRIDIKILQIVLKLF